MDVQVIKTGSAGNCLILNNQIALDMGVSFKAIPAVKELKIVFITHAHGDHCNKITIRKLAQERPTLRFAVPEWLVHILHDCGVDKRNIDVLPLDKWTSWGVISVMPQRIPHDVDNCCFHVNFNDESALYATDCVSLDHVEAKGYDMYMIEGSYHEAEIVETIRQKEVAGEFCHEYRKIKTHLSIEKATEFICNNAGANSKYILLHGGGG